MALQKQPVNINFSQGLDLKTDSKQLAPGKFLSLNNTSFTKQGLLTKRNGFGSMTSLPDATSKFCTTFNNNLLAIGDTLQAYAAPSQSWFTKGSIKSASLKTLPLIRSNTNQSYADAALAPNGLICTVFTDNVPVSGTVTPEYKYVVADSVTGQNILPPAILPGAGVDTYAPKVFLLGKYFIIVFNSVVTATNHLQYVVINTAAPVAPVSATDISTTYAAASTGTFDGVVANNNLYIVYNGSDGGGAVRITYIDSNLTPHGTKTITGQSGTHFSIAADTSNSTPTIWATWYSTSGTNATTTAVNQNLVTVLAPTQLFTGVSASNITTVATLGELFCFYEVINSYSFDSSIQRDYIRGVTCLVDGTVGTPVIVLRAVGLASKPVIYNGVIYFVAIYNSPYQPTYFLLNGHGDVVAKLAYSNGGQYYVTGLPNLTVTANVIQFPYLIKDSISAVNKTQGAAVGSVAGIYSQLGINLASVTIVADAISTAEIGGNLNISGAIAWAYDGYLPVEQGFNLWPDLQLNADGTWHGLTTSTTGGNLADQQYYYQVTYEWSDNQGNVFRSAPSVPVPQTTTGGGHSANTMRVPTLTLTYKTENPVKIVIYRWSVAQQTYYQVTSLTNPVLNDPTVDFVTFVDTQADSAIIGNNILYTTGGVIENIGPPATDVMALFNNRLFMLDAEDPNLLWYSKQVIESTPVEMSDLLTIYVAPTTSAQGSTGPTKAISALDDKLVLFKQNAIYYINGVGPDNTGANSQYSDATFITATVGCSNQASIVFMPNGLMFQSDKGIWLLGRDLSTNYIGAPVEDLTFKAKVQAAVNVPGTNEVRFTMDTGITLAYNYFYGQWSTFINVPAVSATIYNNLHTYINSLGQVFQETLGKYLDGSSPVLMSFTTGWMNLAQLQGYERFYFFYLIGSYLSPHKLSVQIGYDYEPTPKQTNVISPDNYSSTWGSDSSWGASSPWGGPSNLEQWRIFPQVQKCQAFQITIKESFDASFGTVAGAGLTLSGMDLVIGIKSGYPRLTAARTVG